MRIQNLPELLNRCLLLPCDSHMARIVDGKEEDVPVGAEPGDEERAREGFKGALDYLSCAYPG